MLFRSIVSNDQGNDIANKVRSADAAAGSTIIISYNDYGDLWTGSDSVIPSTVSNISLDPLLSANVATLYQPTIGSPAIDAGLNSASRLPSIDLQGRGRSLDGNGDGSSVTDIGSYEYSR